MSEHQRDIIMTAIIVAIVVILAYSLTTAGVGLWEIDPGFFWDD